MAHFDTMGGPFGEVPSFISWEFDRGNTGNPVGDGRLNPYGQLSSPKMDGLSFQVLLLLPESGANATENADNELKRGLVRARPAYDRQERKVG